MNVDCEAFNRAQRAEVVIDKRLFAEILSRIERLRFTQYNMPLFNIIGCIRVSNWQILKQILWTFIRLWLFFVKIYLYEKYKCSNIHSQTRLCRNIIHHNFDMGNIES